MSRWATALAASLLLGTGAAQAGALTLEGRIIQGGLVRGHAEPGSRVFLDGASLRVAPTGAFVFGFGRDAAPEAVLTVRHPGGREELRTLSVAQRRYDVQRIDGLPEREVTPPEEVWERLAAEKALIAAARRRDTAATYFQGGFVWPARGPVSGVYGSQRILNGKPRRPHRGTDIAAPEGAPVYAAAAGVVALAHDGMYYTGKTVMLDHGHDLTSVYIHLSEIRVRAGDVVARGQPIGAVGRTGRATGPHLHWGVYWGETPLDPALLVPPMPATAVAE